MIIKKKYFWEKIKLWLSLFLVRLNVYMRKSFTLNLCKLFTYISSFIVQCVYGIWFIHPPTPSPHHHPTLLLSPLLLTAPECPPCPSILYHPPPSMSYIPLPKSCILTLEVLYIIHMTSINRDLNTLKYHLPTGA